MLQTNRIKWLTTVFLCAVVLVLVLLGGKWGTSFAANAGPVPIIDHIDPAAVPVRYPFRTIVIFGTDLYQCSVWVRLTAPGIDNFIIPLSVEPNGISFRLDASYFIQPGVYTVYVVSSNPCTSPRAPYLPEWDEISNAVTLTVFQPPHEIFLPLLQETP